MANVTLHEIIYDQNAGIFNIYKMVRVSERTVRRSPRPVAMALYIDGACRGYGTPDAIASWGVYFGPNSRLNRSGLLPSHVNHTSTRAEIEALVQAMHIIRNAGLLRAVPGIWIFTDSTYLYNAMTRWVGTINNGGWTSQGTRVSYMNDLLYIDDAWDDLGRDVISFELIGRGQNSGAGRLANMALDNEERRRSNAVGKYTVVHLDSFLFFNTLISIISLISVVVVEYLGDVLLFVWCSRGAIPFSSNYFFLTCHLITSLFMCE